MTNVRRELLMPPVTPSMTAGKISRWHVAEGQAVAAGDILVEVATPTATLEVEAENEGHVERILVPAGTEGVEVNTPIAILLGAAGGSQAYGAGFAAPLTFAGLAPATRREAAPSVAMLASEAVSALSSAYQSAFGPTYREALHDALFEAMQEDPAVFVIGADVALNRGAPRVTQGLIDAFGPQRVVSVPALDEAMIGMAVGAALAGLKPVVELSSWGRALEAAAPYLTSAAETFYHSGGRLKVPIVFRGSNGFAPGLVGEGARCVASLLAQMPGLKVVQPSSPRAAKALLLAAIQDPGPVAVLEDERLYALAGSAFAGGAADDGALRLGQARLARAGRDVTVAALGHSVQVALAAAIELQGNGIEAEVIDLVSVCPLDSTTVASSVGRTGRFVTLEEGWGTGGIGAELIARLVEGPTFAALKNPPLRIAGTAVPMPYAAELQEAAVPTASDVVRAVTALVRGG